MARKVYLNKREGVGKEIATLVVILLVVSCGLWFVFRLFFAANESLDNQAVDRPALSGDSECVPKCFPEKMAKLKVVEFKGSAYTCSTLDAISIWAIVRSSPYVKGNKLYETILNNTEFIYDAQDDSVNAFATTIEKEQVKRPAVCLLGGATRFAKLIATVLSYDLCEVRTNATAVLLSKMSSRDCFALSEVRAGELHKCIEEECEIIGANETIQTKLVKARELRNELLNGILLGILAHEAGHQAYGHVHNQDDNRKNLEISRNQERDADSFCASVMSSSPYGKHMFEGTVFWWWVMARQELDETTDSQRGHPLSIERFRNIVRANESMVRQLGIMEVAGEKLWQ